MLLCANLATSAYCKLFANFLRCKSYKINKNKKIKNKTYSIGTAESKWSSAQVNFLLWLRSSWWYRIELALLLKYSSSKVKLWLDMRQLNLKCAVIVCHPHWDPLSSRQRIRICVGWVYTHCRILTEFILSVVIPHCHLLASHKSIFGAPPCVWNMYLGQLLFDA